jgi:uncharacterized protein (TIGR01777 family)
VSVRALVTGATGFIGGALLKSLVSPIVLTRDPGRARRSLPPDVVAHRWEPIAGPPPVEALRGADVVIHLAGDPVAQRWNEERKRSIRDSRVLGTRHLVQALGEASPRPRVLVSASAVGYYGDRGDEVLDESSAPGHDFLAGVCRDWEAEAMRAKDLGLRVVCLRTGIVLGREGGALPKMLPPFRFGLGGTLGDGSQWMPWIHIDDHISLIHHATATAEVQGPMNAVSPTPVTNDEFTRSLASALKRPAFLPVPLFALKLMFGEMGSVMLSSDRAVPRVAERTGFAFRHPAIDAALRSLVG